MLRVLATNRIVRDKLKGQGHSNYWVATRRLTPTAGWLGVSDRGALPEGERADQLKQDVRMRRPPKAIGASRIRADRARCRGRKRQDRSRAWPLHRRGGRRARHRATGERLRD
jgi:N-acyl-D-aspartate/D-glutamate deacylase